MSAKWWLIGAVSLVVIFVGARVLPDPSDDPAVGSQSSSVPAGRPAEKLNDPAYKIAEDILLRGMDVTRANWVGREIEFKFWPGSYERAGAKYRFFGTDTDFTCDLGMADFERIKLRRTGEWIVVRGTVGPILLDQNIPIQNCQVVSIDATGWSAD